jgi:hypothetical protein
VLGAIGVIAALSAIAQDRASELLDVNISEPPQDWSDESMRDAREPEILVDINDVATEAPPQAGEFHVTQAADRPDTNYAVASSGDFNKIPLRYSGKLFFEEPNGNKARCSAQFIAPNILLTAAHCVRDSATGAWHKNFAFALQYNNDQFSKKYTTKCAFTSHGWLDSTHPKNESETFDYALLVTSEDSITGHFGWSTGWRGRFATAVKIGYPRDIEGGRIVQLESGPITFPKDRPGTVAMRHANPKSRQGSSGGAFVANFDPNGGPGGNTIISVTSASLSKDPGVSLGPYLDAAFQKLFERALRGC